MYNKLNYTVPEMSMILGSFMILAGVFVPWFNVSFPFRVPGQVEELVGVVYGHHLFAGKVMIVLALTIMALTIFKGSERYREIFMLRLVSTDMILFLFLVYNLWPLFTPPSRLYLQPQLGPVLVFLGCAALVYGVVGLYRELPP